MTSESRRQVAEGLLYTHTRLNANTSKTLETTAFLYALIELLDERGIISIEELDARKRAVAERLVAQYRQNGLGVVFQEGEHDKYHFLEEAAFDCAGRAGLCRAACCRLPFALSKQDLREGIVHWDFGQPYMIAQDGDGYCAHFDRDAVACTIYDHRPVPCRGFDCRNDRRVWLDFEQMIVNPDIYRDDWPQGLTQDMPKEREGTGP